MIRYYSSKFARGLLTACEPIGLLWIALLLLTIALWRQGQRRFAAATAALVLFIQLVGGSDLSLALIRTLERPYAEVKFATLPTCDAVVVLGGGFEPSPREVAHLHLTPAGDRIIMALELLRLGKAPVLCIGGSGVYIGGKHFVESEVVAQALAERQLTTAEILPLGRCANTAAEALEVRKIAAARGWRRVLLVTSANHLGRAEATFRSTGVDVLPVPCNFIAYNGLPGPSFRLRIPSYVGFARFATWMHEWVGWQAYRARGWITLD